MILHLTRIVFFLVVMAMAFSYAFRQESLEKGSFHILTWVLIPTLAAVGVIFADMFWRRKRINMLSGLFFGILAGLAIAFALSLLVDLGTRLFPGPPVVEQPIAPRELVEPAADAPEVEHLHYREAYKTYWARRVDYNEKLLQYEEFKGYIQTVHLTKLLIGAFSVFICVTIIFQTKDEFRFIIPYVEFSKQTKGAVPLLLDTSVIIDGRLPDIIETKIFQSELIVPRFVLAELQAVADSHDKLKRNRGRRGLDVLQTLQANPNVDIDILDIHIPSVDNAKDVDTKLISLAQHLSGNIMTNDYNLNKLANVRGVDVININDLSNALKPVVLPGEKMQISILRSGEAPGQGVGYLADGTMVVVEEGRDHIGKKVLIQVTSALQTSAGRMIFGRYISELPKDEYVEEHAEPYKEEEAEIPEETEETEQADA